MIHWTRKLFMGGLVLLLAVAACEEDNGPDTLDTPANVVATPQSPSRIRVTWTAVSGAASYVVERAEGATGGTFAEVGAPTTSTFDDSGLNPSSTYRYRVAAVAGTNRSTFSSEVQGQTQAPGTVVINADITANRTFFRDTVYRLSAFIHVQAPATLTVESGTLITGDQGSALFVMRGAKILAIGTATQPIVMTSSQPVGQRRSGDWGGLIIIGNATINRTGVINIEGTGTTGNPLINYGQGANDADDSGELRYVRVEFAGFGPAQDQELNSFTFAALGSATRLSYLQALAGLDDAFEWFGGTADAKYLVSYNTGDDHFDMSEGFRGRLQYLIAFQSSVQPTIRPGAGNTSTDPVGIENDGCGGATTPGCTLGFDSAPLTVPLVANFTLIGTGAGTWVDATGGGYGLVLRRGTGGYYVNGAVARWPKAAFAVRDAATGGRLANGELVPRNVLVAQDNTLMFQAGQQAVDAGANQIIQGTQNTAALFTAAPTTPANAAALDFTPSANSPLTSGGLAAFTGAIATKAGTFVAGTAFRGGAPTSGTDLRWWAGWTNYAIN
jgi:hypothetical protein